MRWVAGVFVTVLYIIQYSSSQKEWCNQTFTRQFETVYFYWYKKFGNENCIWTFNPPTPEATCFMLSINTVNFLNQAQDTNLLYLLLPDNVEKIKRNVTIPNHSCRIYSKSVEYVYSPKSWAPSECNTTTVAKDWPPRIKMKLFDTRMFLNYAFLDCEKTINNTTVNLSEEFTVAFSCAVAFGALLIFILTIECVLFVRKRLPITTDDVAEVSFTAEMVYNEIYNQYNGHGV
ncbi:uncharacterized protein LOC144751183 [Ciona intestinalis]